MEDREDFLANLSLWTKSAYESHWTRELKALVDETIRGTLEGWRSWFPTITSLLRTLRSGVYIVTESGLIFRINFFGTTSAFWRTEFEVSNEMRAIT